MSRTYRSSHRLQPFTVDYYEKSGRFVMSEQITARHEAEALMIARKRVQDYGAANCKIFYETLATRDVADDIHRALRDVTGDGRRSNLRNLE